MVVLAHQTGGGGGGNSGALIPLLLVAAVLVGTGLSRRGKQGVAPWTVWGLVGLGVVVGIGGILYSSRDSGRPDVHISIVEPRPGTPVPADVPVRVRVSVDGKLATGPADREGGHLHLSVNGRLQQMPYGTEAFVTLKPGAHQSIAVEYVDNRHLSYKPPIVAELVEVVAR